MLESLKQFNGQLGEGATLSANISKLTPKEISRGINNFVQDKRLGIGRGFHKGKGWDSHGISLQPRAPARSPLAPCLRGARCLQTVPACALAAPLPLGALWVCWGLAARGSQRQEWMRRRVTFRGRAASRTIRVAIPP